MTPLPDLPPSRPTYRHGDLHRALLEAGVSLAREGGPSAVTLREATRRAGVVPNAAYRHFASHAELLHAVRTQALAAAAAAIEAQLNTLEPLANRSTKAQRSEHAHTRLRCVGLGYVQFARAEPGLFRTAFSSPVPPTATATATVQQGHRSGLGPFQLLRAAIDDLVIAGVLPIARRTDAEYVAWSAVHGLAILILDGPLHAMPAHELDRVTRHVLETVDRGL